MASSAWLRPVGIEQPSLSFIVLAHNQSLNSSLMTWLLFWSAWLLFEFPYTRLEILTFALVMTFTTTNSCGRYSTRSV